MILQPRLGLDARGDESSDHLPVYICAVKFASPNSRKAVAETAKPVNGYEFKAGEPERAARYNPSNLPKAIWFRPRCDFAGLCRPNEAQNFGWVREVFKGIRTTDDICSLVGVNSSLGGAKPRSQPVPVVFCSVNTLAKEGFRSAPDTQQLISFRAATYQPGFPDHRAQVTCFRYPMHLTVPVVTAFPIGEAEASDFFGQGFFNLSARFGEFIPGLVIGEGGQDGVRNCVGSNLDQS